MSTIEEPVPPVVCTLTIGKRATRQLEWGDLAPLALTSVEIDGGVAATYPLELADQIEDLANKEISCCGSWLDIAHERSPEALHVTLTTRNPDGLDIIKTLSGFPL